MKLIVFLVMVISCSPVVALSLPDLVQKSKQSIVAVGTYMPKRSPRGLFLGTGFSIGNGMIVTNAHVIPKKTDASAYESLTVFVRLNKQIKMSQVKQLAVDPVHDIAILKMSSGSLPALSLSTLSVREGQSIAFTGFPIGMVLGLYPVTHQGIVSAISPIVIPMLKSRQLNARLLKRLRDPYLVYQLDATAYPGNSGSPVFNTETGQVIGVVNKVFVKESKETILSKPSGITYAIPIKHLENLLKNINN